MNTSRTCPQCGEAVAPNGLDGLCPECMMKVGLETQGGAADSGTSQPSPPPPLADVARLFPQLEILEYLGRGGMGAVYKARQPRLDRLVALKIIIPGSDQARDAHFAERFEREARTLAKLNHPNIVTVYDFGEAGNLPYF
ncbi:MAG TPA: protein kinase, partial [Verrucomicrobiae bacterium]